MPWNSKITLPGVDESIWDLVSSLFEAVFNGAAMHNVNFFFFISGNNVFILMTRQVF